MARKAWDKTRDTFSKQQRRTILAQHPTCQACGQHPSTIADHRVPVAEGGATTLANGQALCAGCHTIKTNLEIARGKQRNGRKRPPMLHPAFKTNID